MQPFAFRLLVTALAFAVLTLPIAAFAAPAPPASTGPTIDSVLGQTTLRALGPTTIGGRVSDLAVDPKNVRTIYAATGTGGLWKFENAGTAWKNVFAHEHVASIGAVTLDPTDAKSVWVGTGEGNGRNSSSWGDGIYHSSDAGASWKRVWTSPHTDIPRIVVDPTNHSTVYAAVLGDLFGPTPERGVYKSSDGGATWKQALHTDARTGAVELAMDPKDPKVLYACMYGRKRNAYSLDETSASAGIYKTTDAGATWTKLTKGLPKNVQRSGVAIAPSAPNTVYAIVDSNDGGARSLFDNDSKAGGVFRSTDGGATWERRSGYDPRAFYFSQIRVDPRDPQKLYDLNFAFAQSSDGGASFTTPPQRNAHPDWHALWIDPSYPDHLIAGTDGGVYDSWDNAKSWHWFANMPTGEFYHVSYSTAHPYDVCGGMQDNSTFCGPIATLRNDGPSLRDFVNVGGGDGFYSAVDPKRPWVVYAESQGGNVVRRDLRSGISRDIHPVAPEGTRAYRFNWNTPLLLDSANNDRLFIGGSRVFAATDEGKTVRAISPELAKGIGEEVETEGSSAENHGTITTLGQSPLDAKLLWAGTDDGNVWYTRDGGGSWTNVAAHLPTKLKDAWIRTVEPSHEKLGRVYVAANRHYDDDFAPYLFVSDDFGATFKPLVAGLPTDAPIKVVREDPVDRDLLYVGTEYGLWLSFDRGATYHAYAGLQTVSVDDIEIDARERDLLLATHGAGLFVMDDIAPLETLSASLSKPAALFDVRDVYARDRMYLGVISPGDGDFVAANPPAGAILDYYLHDTVPTGVQFAFTDASGTSVGKVSGTGYPGLQRVVWNAKKSFDGLQGRPDLSAGVPFVAPGTYTVTMTAGTSVIKKTFNVVPFTDAMAVDRLK